MKAKSSFYNYVYLQKRKKGMIILMQKILGYLRKAIEHYNMIEEGDKVAVALSGGKGSITLLKGLKALQRV